MTTLMNHLDYVGVMALELFVSKDERGHDYLLANEIAPRVHNSGHWSIEGAVTSQFENHIRAVVGLPLGDTDNVHPVIMLNVLGQYPDTKAVLAIDGAHYHSYHKAEREDRKIAHITLMPNDVADLEPALAKLVTIMPNKMGLDKKSNSLLTSEAIAEPVMAIQSNDSQHERLDATDTVETATPSTKPKSSKKPINKAKK